MEQWGGFTDVELNSLRQRGRGRRASRRSRGPPLNQGTRKVIYPIGRGENGPSKPSGGDLPSDAFFSRKTQPAHDDKPPDNITDVSNDGKQDSNLAGEDAAITKKTGEDASPSLTERYVYL